MSNHITVEVAYALPDRQEILALSVEQGCTALEAVKRSGIAEHFPEIDVNNADMGIFSKIMDGKTLPVPSEYVMEEKDRVEIYRPLEIDPKQARLARAEKAKKKKAAEAAQPGSADEARPVGKEKAPGKDTGKDSAATAADASGASTGSASAAGSEEQGSAATEEKDAKAD